MMAQAPSPNAEDDDTVILETPEQKCFKICNAHFQIEDDTFKCEEFGPSATTNYIYKCSWEATGQEPSQVLVRIYGKIVEEPFPTFLIRNLVVFNILAERNLGPKCYGYNQESRIEELYKCVHVERGQKELGLYFEYIARRLAEIHTQDMPLTKAPTFLFDFCTPRISNIQNWILTEGISKDAVMKINSFFKQNPRDAICPLTAGISELAEDGVMEIYSFFKQNLNDVIKATADLKSEVVFSHNGLTKGDVLQLTVGTDQQPPIVKLIDFEYSSYNYRAYDLSMLFIECCIEYRKKDTPPNFDFNSKDYFAPEVRKQICKAYLIARSNTEDPTDGDVNRLFHETEICELAVHLVWAVWGVDQHIRGEKILFGYLEYAVAHLREYIRKRELRLPDGAGD